MLGALPASPSDVHLFLNGSELIPGKDYLLDDKAITLLTVPQGADLQSLSVLYQTQFVPDSAQQQASLDQRTVINRAVLGLTLRDRAIASNQVQRSHESGPMYLNGEPLSSPRSLSLLVRTLREADIARITTGASNKKRRNSSTKGIDGLGDLSSHTNYSLLLGTSSTSDAPRSSEQRTAMETRARSLVMLQRRIDEAGSK